MIVGAVVLITAALLLYSVGVWSERLVGVLRGRHVAFFAAGFFCDTAGTVTMGRIVGFRSAHPGLIAVMEWSGFAALVLMGVHLAWALLVLLRGSERARHTFHRFSVLVWCLWLVPYVAGAVGSNS